MPRIACFLLLCLLGAPAHAAERFPGAEWEHVAPAAQGWSVDGLAEARAWSQRVAPLAAVMIVQHGAVIAEWGDTATRSNLHSVRKSLLSALIGIAVAEGKIELGASLATLGIDDNPPVLTPAEQQASVHDLLAARSGVYHPALYESRAMAAARPVRGSHPPGSFWYYNNWDFNALGTIYERAASERIFDAFDRRIARPIGMQDYRPGDGEYVRGADSIHPAYPIRMSVRDLARFALLYLRQGEWKGQRIVPPDWVAASTRAYSDTGSGSGYGYLWWTDFIDLGRTPTVKLPPGSYSAQGFLGQYAFVIPKLDLVIVHRINSDRVAEDTVPGTGQVPSLREMCRLLWLILSAAGATDIGPDASLAASRGIRLTGDMAQRMLAGRILSYRLLQRDEPFELHLRADGTFSARRGRMMIEYDSGTWRIDGDRLCRERRTAKPATVCHAVTLQGPWVQLYDGNGLMEVNAGRSRE